MTDVPLDVPVASSNRQAIAEVGAGLQPTVAGTDGTSRGVHRLGPRGLRWARENLSERDRAVLYSVSQLRLATSRHLETLHYQDAATPLTAARKARRTLHRLVALGLLRRLERRIGGLHAGSAGYIYVLTAGGQRVIGQPGARRRVSEPSWPFIAHTLAVADLFVEIHRIAAKVEPGDIDLLDVQTEPTCWRSWEAIGGGRNVLRPDLYLALGVGADELRWFIEVDRATEHRPALRAKAEAYQRYYDSDTEQRHDGVFPCVAWVVPDQLRRDELLRLLTAEGRFTEGLFAVFVASRAAWELVGETSNNEGGET